MPSASTQIPGLVEQIQVSIDEYRRLKLFNQFLGGTLATTGIVFGLISTLYGIHGQPKAAAGFAASSATIQAILFAYPLESRSKFYRKLTATSQNLLLDLKVKDFGEEERKLLETYKFIRLRAAAEEPEGSLTNNSEEIEKSIASLEKILTEYKNLQGQVDKNGENILENQDTRK